MITGMPGAALPVRNLRREQPPPMEWAARLTGEPDPPTLYRETGSTAGWQPFLPSISWA